MCACCSGRRGQPQPPHLPAHGERGVQKVRCGRRASASRSVATGGFQAGQHHHPQDVSVPAPPPAREEGQDGGPLAVIVSGDRLRGILCTTEVLCFVFGMRSGAFSTQPATPTPSVSIVTGGARGREQKDVIGGLTGLHTASSSAEILREWSLQHLSILFHS